MAYPANTLFAFNYIGFKTGSGPIIPAQAGLRWSINGISVHLRPDSTQAVAGPIQVNLALNGNVFRTVTIYVPSVQSQLLAGPIPLFDNEVIPYIYGYVSNTGDELDLTLSGTFLTGGIDGSVYGQYFT